MANITASFGSGGANLAPGGSNGSPSLALALRDIADDLETIRAWAAALATKLNADAGVTDVNYATISAGSIKTKKV